MKENPCLTSVSVRNLKKVAVESVRNFYKLSNAKPQSSMSEIEEEELLKASCRCCALEEAYAIILGIHYDAAAEIIHAEAKSSS